MTVWNKYLLRTGTFLPAVVLLMGLLFSGAAALWQHRTIGDRAQAEFERLSNSTAAEIASRFHKAIYGLNGAKGLYAASRSVDRAEFRAYVDARDLALEFPGVRGLGFIQQVARKNLDTFVAAERADGAPQFAVRQLNDRLHDDLFIIKFIEPIASNAGAMGLDVGSEAVRRAGAQQAVDTGQPTITGSLTLVQDHKQTPGVLLYVPVFAKGTHPTNATERRAALVGLLYAPLIVAELLNGMPDVQSGRLDFEVFDAPVGSPRGTLMFDADNHVPRQLAQGPNLDAGRRFSTQQSLVLPGRELTLSLNSTPLFDASIDRHTPLLLLVGGIIASLLLTLLLRQQIQGRDRAERLARSMTADLSRLAAVVKHSSNAVVITNPEGIITWVNAGFERITGFSAQDALGHKPGALLQCEATDRHTIAQIRQALEQVSAFKGSILNQTKDGRRYWIELEIQPLRDAGGVLQGFMAIESDITAQRQSQERMEAALRDSEALLSAMNLHAIISTADRTGAIIDLNDAFCDISGYSREELMGKNHRIVNSGVHPAGFWADMWKTIATGMPWRGEICNRAKEGHLYWVDTFIAPFIGDDGQIDKYISIRTDTTASKQAQDQVLRSTELLRGSIEAIDEAFVLYDPQDRLVLCNEKYREIYAEVAHLMVPGARFEDIIRHGAEHGQYLAAVGRIDEWVAERVAAHLSGNTTLVQRLANGRTLRIIERKLPDGHIVGFRIDITELTQATEAAQYASQSKSQFLANMSHEIRTPMNAILGMLTLLQKTALTPKQADYAAKSDGAARALLGLINEILDFSKIEAGKMTLDPHPFGMDQLLRDLSVLLSSSAGAKPVEVLYDIDTAMPRQLVGDAMRLQQVLLNLGSNAIKFTPEGNVVLSMKVMRQTQDAVTLQISMQDSGIGIAPENQARIFNGFTQAESSTTRRFGGTGLGVAISQRFVALMGGELELQSALGQGSRFYFTITLALAQEPSEPSNPPPGHATPALHGPMRALMVDDNPIAREVLEQMGLSLGWTVDVVQSGAQALELLQSNASVGITYQVVFVDWQMPGMDGWQTSQAIHGLHAIGAVPVIVMVTAHGREMLAQRSDAEHALLDGFLVKPVTAFMLRDAVIDARSDKNPVLLATTPTGQTTRRLDHMRLLVVEDNPNNQQVARELLEDEGALVQIAQHGQEGVYAVANANPQFDVVLMDLQMPVMDGFTATHHIRTVLGMTTLPIVAMTANAMASDREACLAAGMNDHVGKPFDLNSLVRVLRQQAHWTDLDKSPDESHPALALGVTDTAAHLGIDLAGALGRLGGKHALYQRMLSTFVRDLGDMPEQLQGFAHAGLTQEAKRMLHTLKGLAATLGATDLAAQAAQCEKHLADDSSPAGSAEALARAVQQACNAIAHATPGLQALVDALLAARSQPLAPACDPATGPTPIDAMALGIAATSLQNLLREGNMDAMQSMAELQQRFGDALGDTLNPLGEAMAELDFEAALSHCGALIESWNA